ncbi:MAG TPA: bifunctional demethylmenaquinone methyltransferase/2-methoxy-6-polyprenyl-1,4-benzoquinol methylase UbiE [Arachidicoccus soli]|nr:bifunctional demethylmenaquinone methyltransferase/2-methoxy-6-polyprenyl-1,4-benzoquinol methylase UbiE [Arachidicoccus soli]
MTKFAHDDIKPIQGSNLEKKEQVAEMFNDIAFKYDFLNRFLSAGIDVRWRKKAIDRIKDTQPARVLDVATGTADVALMTYKILKPAQIIGIDISEGMLDIGRDKIQKAGLNNRISLQVGDSENLPFEDGSFDAITVAFGVRNFQNLEKGLSEMHRVLRPGGKLVVLEFSRPKQKIFKSIYHFYMNVVTPGIGKLFSKNKEAYQYLNESVQAFPERNDFVKLMNNATFKNTLYKPLTMGICCIYEGIK